MLENIAGGVATWGAVIAVVIFCATIAWWALLGQDLLPGPWGVKKLPELHCPDCGEHEAHATFCSLGGCPMRAACEHSSCNLVGRDRLRCDYLACHDRDMAELAFGVAPAAKVISIEGCATVSGWRRHRRRI